MPRRQFRLSGRPSKTPSRSGWSRASRGRAPMSPERGSPETMRWSENGSGCSMMSCRASRASLLWSIQATRATPPFSALLPATAHALGLELLVIEARAASELPVAFANMASDGVQALFISSGPLFLSHRREIVAMAARVRLPAIYGWREFPEAGGLVSYGPSLPDLYRQSAIMVDKIFKGASPADLPVEVPTRFELVVNLKTAKALGRAGAVPAARRRGDE